MPDRIVEREREPEEESSNTSLIVGLVAVLGLSLGAALLLRKRGLSPRMAIAVERELWAENSARRQQIQKRLERRRLEKQIESVKEHLAGLQEQLLAAA